MSDQAQRMREFANAVADVYRDAHQEWLRARPWKDREHRCDERLLGCPQCQCRDCLAHLVDNPDDPTGEPICMWCAEEERRQLDQAEARRAMPSRGDQYAYHHMLVTVTRVSATGAWADIRVDLRDTYRHAWVYGWTKRQPIPLPVDFVPISEMTP